MLISIIIRTTGRLSLYNAVESVLAQTYQNFEIIIIEDGSNNAPAILKHLFNNPKIFYHKLESKHGRSCAGNIGMEHARGTYINFLDDDDIFYSNHLEVLVSNIVNDNIVASLAHECAISKNGWETKKYLFPRFANDISIANYLIINNVAFPKQAYIEFGGFDLDIDYLEDWVLWAKYSQNYQIKQINKVTSCYYVPFSLIEYFKRFKLLKQAYPIALEKVQQFNLGSNNKKTNLFCHYFRKIKILLVLIASRIVIHKKIK